MSRSVKKGPYVAPELLKRVEEMNLLVGFLPLRVL